MKATHEVHSTGEKVGFFKIEFTISAEMLAKAATHFADVYGQEPTKQNIITTVERRLSFDGTGWFEQVFADTYPNGPTERAWELVKKYFPSFF